VKKEHFISVNSNDKWYYTHFPTNAYQGLKNQEQKNIF